MDGDVEQLHHGLRRALQSMMLFNIPAMLGLFVVAEPLVLFLFGEKWAPSIPLLQALSLAGLVWPMQVINLNVLIAQGRSREFLKLEVVKKLIGIGIMIAAAIQGVLFLAWAQVLLGAIALLINTYYSGKLLNYGVVAQMRDIARITGAGIVMMLGILLVKQQLFSNVQPWVQFIVLVFTGTSLFALLAWVLRLPGIPSRFTRRVNLAKGSVV